MTRAILPLFIMRMGCSFERQSSNTQNISGICGREISGARLVAMPRVSTTDYQRWPVLVFESRTRQLLEMPETSVRLKFFALDSKMAPLMKGFFIGSREDVDLDKAALVLLHFLLIQVFQT